MSSSTIWGRMSKGKEMMRLGCERVERWGCWETYLGGTMESGRLDSEGKLGGRGLCSHGRSYVRRFCLS